MRAEYFNIVIVDGVGLMFLSAISASDTEYSIIVKYTV